MGSVYDLGTSLACVLMAEGAAEPVAGDSPLTPRNRVRPRAGDRRDEEIAGASGAGHPRDVAADREPRPPRRR